MAIREGSFYPVFPILDGTPMSRQWGISRSNTAELKAIARNSYQELEADQDELNALRALIGQAYGDLDFRNRFRFAYDSDTDELLCQSNIGTVDDPEWSDAWQVRFHDNQVQIVGDGGIYSSHGFYSGDDTLQSIKEVAEVGDDADVSISNPTKLFFDTDAGLSVSLITSGGNAGHPKISVDRPFGQAQEFVRRGRVWEVAHNYGITPVLAQVMDTDYRIVIPDKADLSDPNTAYFYFNEVFSGSVYIASGGVGAASLAPRDPFYLVVRTDEMKAADHVLESNADLAFDADYFYVNVDLDTSSGGAHKSARISLTNKVFDHGTLVGLDDVADHPSYALTNGTRNFTGNVSLKNSADSAINLILDPGNTLVRNAIVRFRDQGTDTWLLYKDQSNDFKLYDSINNTTPFLVELGTPDNTINLQSTGFVGVGTASPVAKLHVSGKGYFADTVEAESFYVSDGYEVPIAYSEEFSSSVEWTVNHNLNRTSFIAQAYKENGSLFIPESVYVNDSNVAYFYFATAQSGKAVVLGVG